VVQLHHDRHGEVIEEEERLAAGAAGLSTVEAGHAGFESVADMMLQVGMRTDDPSTIAPSGQAAIGNTSIFSTDFFPIVKRAR